MIVPTIILTSCVKLLLIPAYRSTDFEVHRNWLAITHSLPVKKWYFEDTSEWTLDYPPIFAWFEYLLSHIATYFDPQMLVVSNLNYASSNTILFQRLSVIFTDLVLAYGAYRCSKSLPQSWKTDTILPILILANVGLFMVDHIHFQYNGVLFGVLLLSLASILKEDYIMGAFWFAFLLNMKHIYLYIAPAFIVYLFRSYCFNSKSTKTFKELIMSFSIVKLVKLGLVVITVFFLTFVPFYSHLRQVLARMFPFKRGLCHAYWAPNVWAIYNILDKAAVFIAGKVGYFIEKPIASMTGGLVQEFSHTILPNITPKLTMVLMIAFMVPALVKLWKTSNQRLNFIRTIVICALTSFLFGWHVHEKAILMAIIPLSILSIIEPGDAKAFIFLSIVGHYSLFPLLFPKELLMIKVLLFFIYSIYSSYSLSQLYPFQFCKCSIPLLNIFETLYLLGLGSLFFYENFVHSLVGLDKTLPFLPLMLTSVYCSLGVIYAWLKYYLYFLLNC